MILDDKIGKIVYSKSGRDKGRMFVVIEVVNERYVLVSDGDMRTIENPKIKNIKHLQWTTAKAEDVVNYRIKGQMPDNHIIRKNLKRIQDRGEGGLVNG